MSVSLTPACVLLQGPGVIRLWQPTLGNCSCSQHVWGIPCWRPHLLLLCREEQHQRNWPPHLHSKYMYLNQYYTLIFFEVSIVSIASMAISRYTHAAKDKGICHA